VGGLLVGQTWTTFTDLASYADTVDFNGPGSVPLIRQPQVRYTIPLAKGTTLALAVENGPNNGANSWVRLPDFHANFSTSQSWGTFSLRGLTGQYRNPANFSPANIKQGYGLAGSGSLKVGGDTLVYNVQGGKGIGRYMFNLANGQFAEVNANGANPELWSALGYHVGYTHVWTKAWRSNAVWSQTFMYKDNITPNTLADVGGINEVTGSLDNRRIDQAFANTFWTFAKNAEFGLEYAYGKRWTWAGPTGLENRINASFHVNFY
jgi:hypothetical protein